jgi:hypothetical protein
MDTNSELKSLIWDVNESQTDLIKLGDDALKQTGSFVPWVKCHFFGVRLPFKSLADRAESLDMIFTNLKSKLDSFQKTHSSQLTDQDKQAFGLLREFAEALSSTASILKTTQAKQLSASQGERRLFFREVCAGSKQYNESMRRYLEVAGRLQPHINRICEENHTE